jgi:putative Holliday junction resolvase
VAAHETVLAIDFGLRNIGVAVGNTLSRTAQPLAIVNARDGVPDWDALAKFIEEWQPQRVVVGHPLNMDGTESDISKRVMKFARQIEGRYQRIVTLVDERLSSREAKAAALASGHNGDFAAKPIDDEAAAIILSTWLNEQ